MGTHTSRTHRPTRTQLFTCACTARYQRFVSTLRSQWSTVHRQHSLQIKCSCTDEANAASTPPTVSRKLDLTLKLLLPRATWSQCSEITHTHTHPHAHTQQLPTHKHTHITTQRRPKRTYQSTDTRTRKPTHTPQGAPSPTQKETQAHTHTQIHPYQRTKTIKNTQTHTHTTHRAH